MRALTILVMLFGTAVANGADVKPSPTEISPIVAHISEAIPEGWTACYSELDCLIQVERDRKVMGFLNTYNGPQELTPSLYPYKISFHVIPFVSASLYKDMCAENKNIQSKIDLLAFQLRHSPTAHSFMDYFRSNDPEDKEKIAEFDRLRRSLHRLPDFYYGGFSLEEAARDVVPKDDTVYAECDRVRSNVENSLLKY